MNQFMIIYLYIYIYREREREGGWGRVTWHISKEKNVSYLLRSSQSDTIKVDGFILSNTHVHTHVHTHIYAGCPRRNVPDFGRVFLMLKHTDITQNTYVQS